MIKFIEIDSGQAADNLAKSKLSRVRAILIVASFHLPLSTEIVLKT
jgi:hypothetical protein